MTKTEKILNTLSKYEARSMHGQLPSVWDKAEGCMVTDIEGQQYIDFTSGICVANAGHSNLSIINSIKEILEKPLLHSYTFATEIRAKFLRELVDTCYPKGKAFLLSSGTEATECALKLIKMYGLKQNKNTVVGFIGAMHGRTLGAELLRGGQAWTGILHPQIFCFPFPEINDSFEKTLSFYKDNGLVPQKIAGFVVESYRGWDARFYPKTYIQDLVKFAKENKSLVCFDEIQGGFGRTGKMFAFEHYGLTYKDIDLICIGKGMSSSLPLSGVMGKKQIMDIPDVGSMSSTHSANPLVCSVGLANLLEIKKLLPEAIKKGNYFQKYLRKSINLSINGNGLLAAILTKTKEQADKICYKAMINGLFVIKTNKNSVKLAPPLSIDWDNLKRGLEILLSVIKKEK